MTIESELRELLDTFTRASAGLFEITGRYDQTFEQGLYACAIARPTKRMRAALTVDREVLVVASNFKSQQQRTIKFIKREIDTSEGRFEGTVAIIIHNDPEGDGKLKNWGRDQGLSILPLKGSESLKTPGNLEQALCFELYTHDPFDVTGPVSDDANFYGRRDEAIDLARKLQKGQIRSCLGIRKIGKTSIINRVLGETRTSHDCVSLMIDCSRDDVWSLDSAQLLASIAASAEFAGAKESRYASLSPTKDDSSLSAARDRLQALLLSSSKPHILVFDEVDYITPGSPTNPAWRSHFNPFWRNLRSVYQECARANRSLSILVGGVSTYWFTVESIDGVENAALSFVPEEYLSPMAEGATVAMLKRLGKVAGLQLEDAAATRIAMATGNMPYWARKCSSYIHRQIPATERPCVLSIDRARPLIDAFISEEGAAISEVTLRHLFRVHPQLQDATRKCSLGMARDVAEPHKRALRRYGVLALDDSLAGEMITLGFNSLISATSADSLPVLTADPSSNTLTPLNEWAEELAAIGKRRNLLEKRLRDIALNFLRFSALNPAKPSDAKKPIDVKERLLSILPNQRSAAMKHLPAEDLINKMLWTELVKVITSEWTLFERLFGDRDVFIRNCEIVNDRFDAHAKPADFADFALYRRALGHLEERVAKLQ